MLLREIFKQGQKIDIRQCQFEIKHIGQTNRNMIMETCGSDPHRYFSVGQRLEIDRCLFLIRHIGEKAGIISMDEISEDNQA